MSTHPALLKLVAYQLRRDELIRSQVPRGLPESELRADLEDLLLQLEDDDLHFMRRTIILGQIESLRRLLGITSPDTFSKGGVH